MKVYVLRYTYSLSKSHNCRLFNTEEEAKNWAAHFEYTVVQLSKATIGWDMDGVIIIHQPNGFTAPLQPVG